MVARLLAPAFAKVLDPIDRGLERGGIHLTLPDGSRRRRGLPRRRGRPRRIELKSWMALVRLATSGSVGWYKAWALGEWSSPDPVPVFELFSLNAESARRCRPRQGRLPLGQCARASPARQCARQGEGQRRRALRPRQRLLFGLARRDDDLFLGLVGRAPAASPKPRPTRLPACLTGSSLRRATACWRSAAAGGAWRSKRQSAAPASSG